jgi:hypothetical protein
VIVGSLLLILVAVVLLVLGLTNGSSAMLIGSIGASLLAAVALVVGARQDTAARADEVYLDDEPDGRVRVDDEDQQGYAESYATAGYAAGRTGQRLGGPADAGSAYAGGPAAAPPAPPMDHPTVTLPPQSTGPPPAAPPRAAPPAEAPAEAGRPAQPVGGGHPVGGHPVGVADDLDDEDPPDEPAPQAVSPTDAARVARLGTDVLVIDGRPRYHLPGCVHLLGRESEPLPASEAVELGFTPCSLCEPASALLTDPRQG